MNYDHYIHVVKTYRKYNLSTYVGTTTKNVPSFVTQLRKEYLESVSIQQLFVMEGGNKNWAIRQHSYYLDDGVLLDKIKSKELADEILEYLKSTELLFI